MRNLPSKAIEAPFSAEQVESLNGSQCDYRQNWAHHWYKYTSLTEGGTVGVDAVRYGWDSFMSMSPFNLHDAWRIHMPVKGYYDGSNRSGFHTLALAGLVGTEAIWPEFEASWKLTLEKHDAPMHEDGIRRFHPKSGCQSSIFIPHHFMGNWDWKSPFLPFTRVPKL